MFAIKFYLEHKSLMMTLGYGLLIFPFPVGGLLIASILYSKNSRLFSFESTYEASDYFTDDEDDYNVTRQLDTSKETKIIPIRMALELEDYTIRRETILNLIKKDINNYSLFMKMALENADSETSHYAASSILHSKRKLDSNMNDMAKKYHEDSSDPAVITAYADELMNFIRNAYLDDDAKMSYINENITILKKIVDEKIDLDSRYLFNLIELLLVNKDFINIDIYCDLLMNSYPKTEETYILVLKSYYVMKDYQNFNNTLEKFRNSGISFSNKTVNIVRFWLGGLS